MIRRRLVFGLVLVLAVLWCCGVSAAEDPDELFDQLSEQQEQRVIELIDEGEEAYDAGEFERAAELFHQVHELFPHPDIAYQLALVYERDGDYEMAIQYYSRFLELMPDAAGRGRIERTIEEYEQRLGDDLSSVRVETNPAGAEIFIGKRDTVPVGETPETVTLEPGHHDIYVEKEGFLPLEETIEIREGHDHLVQYQLATIDEGYESRESSVGEISWWHPTVSVALVGLGALATHQTVVARNDAQYYERQLDGLGGQEGTPEQKERRRQLLSDQSQAHTRTFIAGGVAATAFVGAGVFTAWWLLGDSGSDAGVSVMPRDDGIVVIGRF